VSRSNDAREVAGLLGITVIGAVLRSVQSNGLRNGTARPTAFLNGYHAGLYVAIGVVAVCVVVSYLTLRPQSVPDEPRAAAASADPRPVRG
jgi:hypothetical protein